MELLDLIQEGNLGLEHAVDKFDWRRGSSCRPTRHSRSARRSAGRSTRRRPDPRPRHRSQPARRPGPASGDGETLDQTDAELHRLTATVSLDKTVGHDSDSTLGDLMATGEDIPEDAVMSIVDTDLLEDCRHARLAWPVCRRGPLRLLDGGARASARSASASATPLKPPTASSPGPSPASTAPAKRILAV